MAFKSSSGNGIQTQVCPQWDQERGQEDLGCVLCFWSLKSKGRGFPGGAVVENLPANAGDTGLSPGLGRSHMPRSN